MWWADPEQPGARRWAVITGDCREIMDMLADESVDSVVCDPPYELGFMNKAWDSTGIAFDLEVWKHALRVLKPGGHLLAFSGSRTYHRMACAIEDAGFEIRDQIMWVYGSGFPKSHNLNGEWSGWGTALKPAHEPIVVARKPFKGTVAANVLAHGTGALNIDGCRVKTGPSPSIHRRNSGAPKMDASMFRNDKHDRQLYELDRPGEHLDRWPANLIHDGSDEVVGLFPVTGPAKKNKISDGRSAPFLQAGGDKSGGYSGRRDPSNSHDDAGGSAARFFYCAKASKADREDGLAGFQAIRTGGMQAMRRLSRLTGSGNERTTTRANHHPTVKPTELMRYLCRLVTPPGGIVLDPFTGSGSAGRGAVLEGFGFIGCELSLEYSAIARARIAAVESRADF